MKRFENMDTEGAARRLKRLIGRFPPAAILGVFVCRILPGYRAYRKILKACPPGEGWRIWLMDYSGSGDTYLTCGYLQSKGMTGRKDVFVAAGALPLKVAKLFPFGKYVCLRPRRALTVRLMERFCGQKLCFLPLLYESDYLEHSGIFRRMGGHHGIDFMDMLKIGLEANCGVPYSDGPWRQPVSRCAPEEIGALFRENRLVPGKTVLLAPFAKGHDTWGIPPAFYEGLARRLRDAGYAVCTNVGDIRAERAVPGTQPVMIPYRSVRAFCEAAGCFIGLRSGLCDIISAAEGCKKVILYGDMTIPSAVVPHREFFSLKKMGLCEDVLEMAITDGNADEAIPAIMRYISGGEQDH